MYFIKNVTTLSATCEVCSALWVGSDEEERDASLLLISRAIRDGWRLTRDDGGYRVALCPSHIHAMRVQTWTLPGAVDAPR